MGTTSEYYRIDLGPTPVPLSVDQERRLYALARQGDTEALDTLVRQYLRLVIYVALRTARGRIPADEAISAGNYGMMMALTQGYYAPERGVRLATYITSYVRGYVWRAMRAQLDPRWVPTSQVARLAARMGEVQPEWESITARELLALAREHLSPAELTCLQQYILGDTLTAQARARRVSRQAQQQLFRRAVRKLRRAARPKKIYATYLGS